ncbi:CHC2 zinc finger domain-containing protein [Herbaspirillum frisingense]|uniref:CHC2 zinc finger domain-containing protein n=1 Tax=Herbaspirillum frisingense TaxID=92645 RepID=UPI001F38C87C|nr:CHC2 zinc finger domain-containing protein [Herbaspirillum frisingense]UIN21342.1 toprim domain-containing protein [Herbaspirillum frisingense]
MSRIDYKAITDSLSIEEVARRLGMELKTEAAGRFKALCPFHDDKTPSLLIDANRDSGRQHFYCFACGESGDVIDLTKGVLHVSFKEAINWLSNGAEKKDIVRPRSTKKSDVDTAKELHTGLELGYGIYKKKSFDASFLTWAKSRNLNEQVLRQAGFVFAEENLLSKYLESTPDTDIRREKAEALEQAHLIRKLTPGVSTAFHLPLHVGPQYRDSFLNARVVFPLFDEKRKLVGLGSRAVNDGDVRLAPKYQFTKGFPKGSVLYRAENAFAQIRAASKDGKDHLCIFLCEGFLDALRIEACGLPAVAVMGSSISESQIRLLVNLADTLPKKSTLAVHICFDRDEAGLRGAADACLKLMNALSLECSFVCPSNWPFGKTNKNKVTETLRSSATYKTLLRAAESTDSAHLWNNIACEEKDYPSWAEHRRRRILKGVIASCEALAVDLLVLPEYSIRPETVAWLKLELTGKHLSILAGTHLEFKREPQVDHLRAKLTLLWPVPKDVLSSLNSRENLPDMRSDFLERGTVLEFMRGKKYRSIALEEFFRPASIPLSPLFRPYDLPNKLELAIGGKLPTDTISHLLAETRLPLKHLMELICSEVFLISSPANYLHMSEDYRNLRAKFGEPCDSEEVYSDVRRLAGLLSITGDGKSPRRSILAVPAATSRSADYWIAGQANFLAAGTTSVFCNSVGSKELVGGSCFIGRGSWRSEKSTAGYIPRITPYHGWSKGIFYNSSQDALSDKDQALVVADVDPHNMMEGKPRAQTMPSPLQLVAYLPIIETIDWEVTEKNLLSALSLPSQEYSFSADERRNSRAIKEEDFWEKVFAASTKLDTQSFMSLWDQFPDEGALIKRYKASQNNDDMQPTSSRREDRIFNKPALYDWINVSLTVNSQQSIPSIEVPHWKRR